MRPENLHTNIYLDSGDPAETKEMLDLLGFLDGQTTNPTLVTRNPEAKRHLEEQGGFTKEELLGFYRDIVQEVSELLPDKSVSVEVAADCCQDVDAMLREGREMNSWIPNAHVKLPTTTEGLTAAETLIGEGVRVNQTLCFTQEQAAAVHAATREADDGDVYVSPFIGRLDDRGENGMDVVSNIQRMNAEQDSHVQVLAASIRHMDHLLGAIAAGADIVTVPFDVLKEWGEQGMPLPDDDFAYPDEGYDPIPYAEFDLSREWRSFDISHELTDKGIQQFLADWNELIR